MYTWAAESHLTYMLETWPRCCLTHPFSSRILSFSFLLSSVVPFTPSCHIDRCKLPRLTARRRAEKYRGREPREESVETSILAIDDALRVRIRNTYCTYQVNDFRAPRVPVWYSPEILLAEANQENPVEFYAQSSTFPTTPCFYIFRALVCSFREPHHVFPSGVGYAL